MGDYPTAALGQPSPPVPRWSATGRPSLPPGLAGLDVLHAPSCAGVPPAGSRAATRRDGARPRVQAVPPSCSRRRGARCSGSAFAARSGRRTRSSPSHATPPRTWSRRHGRPRPRPRHPARRLAAAERGRPRAGPRPPEDPPPYVLFVGTLEPRKNLVRLVRAYRRAAGTGLPHSLVLAGPLGWGGQPLLRELELRRAGRDHPHRPAASPSSTRCTGGPPRSRTPRSTRASACRSSRRWPRHPDGRVERLVAARGGRRRGRPASTRARSRDRRRARRRRGRGRARALRAAGLARADRFSWAETARLTLRCIENVKVSLIATVKDAGATSRRSCARCARRPGPRRGGRRRRGVDRRDPRGPGARRPVTRSRSPAPTSRRPQRRHRRGRPTTSSPSPTRTAPWTRTG